MSVIQYRYRLKIGSASFVDCYPRRSGEVSHITEQQEGEYFFRQRIEGNLTFQRSDFDKIHAAPFQTEFRIIVQEFVSGSWQTIPVVGRFFKTDVTFDIDNSTCEVSLKTFDTYEKVLEGLDKEFNLIDLEPPTVEVSYLRQAVIQVVLPGAPFLAEFTDGVWSEKPVPSPLTSTDQFTELANHETMLTDYGFGLYEPSTFDHARCVVVTDASPIVDVSGIYEGINYTGDGFDNSTYRRLDEAYRIHKVAVSGGFRIELDIEGGATVYASDTHASDDWWGAPLHEGITLSNLATPADKVSIFVFRPYVRLLTNKATVDGLPTVTLPSDDPFPHGSFTQAHPLSTGNFVYSSGHGTTPTRWGKIDADALHYAGEYFTQPTSTETLMPVAFSNWKGASAWFYMDDDLRALQQEGSEATTLRHGYKLADVIDKLLEAIGATAGHGDNSTYSDFLYAASNAIRGIRKVPVITPITNITVGDYDTPAKKGLLRLSEVLNLLKGFYNAYFYIPESNFRIEHVHYFENGNSYAGEVVGADMTTQLEPRTGLAWAQRTNRYRYEKTELPERIVTKWMAKASTPFDGYPIEVDSLYVERGKVEEMVLGRFYSDLDFAISGSEELGTDGFFLLECEEDGGGNLSVPFVTLEVSADEIYKVQNGYASIIYAHQTYWQHGLPATAVTINKASVTAESVKRSKIQEIEIILGEDVDPYELVETQVGTGRVQRIEKNLSGKDLKITIRHNTE